MVSDIVLTGALRSTLLSLQRTQSDIDVITERLATGKDVSSALDDPQNFFSAQSLSNRANDLSRLLDGIGQNLRTIEEAIAGLEATERLIDQAEAIALTSRELLTSGQSDPNIYTQEVDLSPAPLSSQILAGNPDSYFRLNEAGGAVLDSGVGPNAPVGAVRQGGAIAGAAPLYENGPQASVEFDGVNDRIAVNDSPQINTSTTPFRTVELVFNADTVAGRQVLYEEGAGVNGFTIYIDNGLARVTAEDDQGGQRFADLDISAPIVAGQTYHIAFVFDGPGDTFEGFLDGVSMGGPVSITSEGVFPSHSGNIGIGAAVDGVQFHDGESGAGFRFDGRISDVAIYNRALTGAELFSHAESLNSATTTRFRNLEFDTVLAQINSIVEDAQYRGVNLLLGDDLITDFNEERDNNLRTEGRDFSAEGLGIGTFDFNDLADIEIILDDLREARRVVREYGRTLVNDLSIIKTRQDFTRETINTLLAGSDDLTVADANTEGANLLASQTRQFLGTTALGLAGISQQSILSLF